MRSTLQSIRARRGQNEKGFTLIELLVVVVIIGVLIAIAIPLYLNYQKSSHDKAADSDVRNAVVVMEQCYADNGSYPTGLTSSLAASKTLTLTDNGCDGQINVSPGTNLLITVDGSSYTIDGWNVDGHVDDAADHGYKTYTFDSESGGSVGVASAPAATDPSEN